MPTQTKSKLQLYSWRASKSKCENKIFPAYYDKEKYLLVFVLSVEAILTNSDMHKLVQ